MKKKKIQVFIIISIIIITGIITSILVIKHTNYIKTYKYKFNKIGYSKEEIKLLEKELKDKELDTLLNNKYNKNITKFIKEKYFIFKNLNDYLNYYEDNKDKSITDIVAIVNTKSNNEFYTNTKKTDISKNELILVNKYNYLTSDYNPDDLKELSNVYSYGTNQMLRLDAYNAFIAMWNKANEDGYKLIINSSYRSYEEQEKIYNNYSSWYGKAEADKKAARPGYSEHQTGLALDIQSYCSENKEFDECPEFTWLINNAYKYGFILRYPKDLDYITGYNYESWHYRYIGTKASTYIHKNNITFDEYYAYFVK